MQNLRISKKKFELLFIHHESILLTCAMVTPSQRDSVEPPLDFTGNVFNHLVKASQKRSSSELISLQSVFLSTC